MRRYCIPWRWSRSSKGRTTSTYCIGGRTGVAIAPASVDGAKYRFSQDRPGLHHLCFRAKSAADVDAIHEVARALGAKIIRAPREDSWAPGYYSVLFEDPDGIRIEANFVPGKGHLDIYSTVAVRQ
jgi:catechol 2,3-dioxygenase-like lactoylglutathione lyase family enzyme